MAARAPARRVAGAGRAALVAAPVGAGPRLAGQGKRAVSALLPAVVLGIDTPIGLAIVRDLGRRGVPVTGIAGGKGSPGLASRYLREGLLRVAGEEGTVAQLEQLAARLGAACLYAISEADIAMLNRHRTRLGGYRLMFGDSARMARVLDKNLTYAAAQRAGVPVPRTVQPCSPEQVREAAATLQYPVVLKWADPNQAAGPLAAAGLTLDKARYCHSAAELLDYLQPLHALGRYPMLQEYCPGYGLGQFVLMRDGVALSVFQHRRLHEWPPEGGASSQCISVELDRHAELMDKSIALLRELDWDGIAMVEYRHDPRTGRSALMEVNGRYWGSLPLACAAGASFPWQHYRLQALGEPVVQADYAAGVRCRFMIPETRRLLRLLFQPSLVADRQLVLGRRQALFTYLLDFVRPGSCYYLFQWRDPGPFLRDIWQVIRQLARV